MAYFFIDFKAYFMNHFLISNAMDSANDIAVTL